MSSFQKQLVEPSYNEPRPSRIVEFVVPNLSIQQLALILPLLGHLSFSDDPRWLACIGPLFIAKRDCLRFGLNRYRLLQVLPSQRCDVIDITERALSAGKSHTVVCVVETASAQTLTRLEYAAELGQCRCIVIRNR